MSYKSKNSKTNVVSKGKTNDKSFQLNANRFITVSDFKGKTRVDIREYYNDSNGEQRPGKKGISLSMEEWIKLKDFLPKIEKAIKGIDDSDVDSDSEDDSRRKKTSKKSKKTEDSDLDSDDDSNGPKKKSKKSDSDEDSDESEKKSKTKRSQKSESESDSEDSYKKTKNKKSKKSESDSD